MTKPRPLPTHVDTVIVGNGPSALILSFILSGNIPYYNLAKPHPDPMLRKKLLASPSLLGLNVADLTAHFAASRLSYSTQALPINTLLDTLIRPLADTDPGEFESCVEWRYEESRRVPHLVFGNTAQAGGQWADNATAACSTIGTLSYAEMLSLPGYAIDEHFFKTCGQRPPGCYRPTREEVADYLAVYPEAVGISDSIFTHVNVEGVSRIEGGFSIRSHRVHCKHLVLASGVFSKLIPPRPLLRSLAATLQAKPRSDLPVLVVGSGFTAADVILSSPPERKMIHIFKWHSDRPSPLQACHPRAYPEYAGVYRRMKIAAQEMLGMQALRSPVMQRKINPFFQQRDWERVYEGFPNTMIKDVMLKDDRALVTLEASDGRSFNREVSGLEYVIGRRGSLGYLDSQLRIEVLDGLPTTSTQEISIRTLRPKAEENLEVAPDVFVIGSLTGDSLIRFAFGGCVFAAGEIFRRAGISSMPSAVARADMGRSTHSLERSDISNDYIITNGHSGLDTEKGEHSLSAELRMAESELWRGTGRTLAVSS
jgi:hypothetical protein